MGREVFALELAEPQVLLDELVERIGATTIDELRLKISASQKQNVN